MLMRIMLDLTTTFSMLESRMVPVVRVFYDVIFYRLFEVFMLLLRRKTSLSS